VVIGIMALVIALLLPSMARAKSAGRSSVCLNNLKQWGLATMVYAGEHDDFLPPDGSPNGSSTKSGWYIDLPKAIELPSYPELPWRTNVALVPEKSIWVCPNSTNKSNGLNLFFYCLNQYVNNTGVKNRPVPTDSIRLPSRTVWLFDNGGRAGVARQNNVSVSVHRKGAHFLFLDGHASRFVVTDYWDFQADRGRTNHPDLVWIP
jgi:prepilin-type processing-associated H-X9-DG protein